MILRRDSVEEKDIVGIEKWIGGERWDKGGNVIDRENEKERAQNGSRPLGFSREDRGGTRYVHGCRLLLLV